MESANTNQELQKLYEQDVAQVHATDWDDKKAVDLLDKDCRERIAKVSKMLSKGEVKTAADYHHAALIFQHGDTAEHFRKAHLLAKKGMELGDLRSKWLFAATYDRWQLTVEKPQKYGTQFRKNESGEWELGPMLPGMTDEERAKYNLPPLADALSEYKKKYNFD